MAILPIVKYGDPILRRKVKLVTDFTNLDNLVKDMLDTMGNESGIGLAANQVGMDMNLLVLDISGFEDEDDVDPRVFVNIDIIKEEGEIEIEEGCLSIPDIRASIVRAETITIEYQDLKGKIKTEIFTGLAARVILHEYDHLIGKYFTDYLPSSQKTVIQKRLKEISETGFPSVSVTLT